MNQFIARIANYVANEILIKGLANSKTFQKMAVRTDARFRSMKDNSNNSINSTLDEIHKAASEHAYSTTSSSSSGAAAAGTKGGAKMELPRPPVGGMAGFFSALGKEIGKDLGTAKVK